MARTLAALITFAAVLIATGHAFTPASMSDNDGFGFNTMDDFRAPYDVPEDIPNGSFEHSQPRKLMGTPASPAYVENKLYGHTALDRYRGSGPTVTYQKYQVIPGWYDSSRKLYYANVYFLWYGQWSADEILQLKTPLKQFTDYIGKSTWWKSVVANTDSVAGVSPAADLQVNINFSWVPNADTTIQRADVEDFIKAQAGNNWDEHAVYVLMADGSVKYSDRTSGQKSGMEFCTNMCAYHDFISMAKPTGVPSGVSLSTITSSPADSYHLKYIFMGDPTACPAPGTQCSKFISPLNAPNGVLADVLINTLAHELAETFTNPVWLASKSAKSKSSLGGGCDDFLHGEQMSELHVNAWRSTV